MYLDNNLQVHAFFMSFFYAYQCICVVEFPIMFHFLVDMLLTLESRLGMKKIRVEILNAEAAQA